MDWQQLLVHARELVEKHWSQIVLTLAGIWIGAWWGKRRAARQWRRKEFLDRLNVSLNILAGGKLQIRTILEENQDAIFLNAVAVDKIRHAVAQATEADSILPLAKDDAWFLLNAVLNEVSERLAVGHFRRDMGQPTQSERYVLALTYECAGEVRTRKVRAMLVKKQTLLSLPKELPLLESPTHETRFRTLEAMADVYARKPHLFMEMEVCLSQ